MKVRYKRIPTYTYETDSWHPTTFEDQEEFAAYLQSIYKEPGEYEFDECTLLWNKEARAFKKNGFYNDLPEDSDDFKSYWQTQKERCRKGVIWKKDGKTWYTPGEYYMLLNFLPVPSNKENNQDDDFCSVRDVQYQMGLYEKIAEALHKHSAILKRRQCMSSNYHAAKFIHIYWFEKAKKLKLLAYDDAYISGPQGTWSILESFRDFLNQNTAWYRSSMPEEVGSWEQKEKVKDSNGRWTTAGRKSSIIGKTLNRDHKKGIGGPSYYVFYEEAGVAPTMDKTLQFLNPAMENGNELAGSFIAAGSVGDLKDCKPLERFIKFPDSYNIHKVPTRWYNTTGEIRHCALFIPAQYGRPQNVDQFGNSKVEEALREIKELDEFNSKNLPPYDYNVWKSQNPTTIDEAFAYREDLFYPVKQIQRAQDSLLIKLDEMDTIEKPKMGTMIEEGGKPVFVPLDKMDHPRPTEMGYPVNPKLEDKRGVVTIYNDPLPNSPLYLNFAGVDPVEGGATQTSDSLFSIHIVSRMHAEKFTDDDNVEKIHYKGGELMASYVGRYDNEESIKIGELLIRYYNASAAVERNKRNFIDHMKRQGLTKHLLRKKELPLFKDVDLSGTERDEYGIYFGADNVAEMILNTSVRDHILRPIEEKIVERKDGTEGVVKTYRVLDSIQEYWLLEELKLWYKGKNADRIRSYGLAVMAANGFETSYMQTVNTTKREQLQKPSRSRNILGGPIRPSTIKRKIKLI